ncbi:hypothetical protein B296_00026427 [Ensete ventricosum]|uniref:Uncharacterized protein n=1 Tax=Ensete ventricosum TaxID=4639 RepID=A0A426Z285_ENSVE|nr:hypothetical protein B296_00026427 [Ensete ventricosum]
MEGGQHERPFEGKRTLRCRERSRSEEPASRIGIRGLCVRGITRTSKLERMRSAQRLRWLSSSYGSTLTTKLDEGLSTRQEDAEASTLEEYATVLSFELSRRKRCTTEIVLMEDRGPGSKHWCTNFSEVEALRQVLSYSKASSRCDPKMAAGELDCFSAHIRLREPEKSEDKAEWSKGARKRQRVQRGSATQKQSIGQKGGGGGMPQRRIYQSQRKRCRCKATDTRAMGLAAPCYRRGGTSVESSIPCSYGGRALVVKGIEEVENAEANSKYQDKAEGQRPRNFIRPVSMGFSSR